MTTASVRINFANVLNQMLQNRQDANRKKRDEMCKLMDELYYEDMTLDMGMNRNTRNIIKDKRIIKLETIRKGIVIDTRLDTLPTDIVHKIVTKNLMKEIQQRKIKDYRYFNFKAEKEISFIKVYHDGERRMLKIHGKDYNYVKGGIINYLKDNGIKGYESWSYKKLIKAVLSF